MRALLNDIQSLLSISRPFDPSQFNFNKGEKKILERSGKEGKEGENKENEDEKRRQQQMEQKENPKFMGNLLNDSNIISDYSGSSINNDMKNKNGNNLKNNAFKISKKGTLKRNGNGTNGNGKGKGEKRKRVKNLLQLAK